jgi:ATP phosphoribosyltransferase
VSKSRLTLALTKGRILQETLPLLQRAGIEVDDDLHHSRKLIFSTNWRELQVILLRGTDVPTYVRLGAAGLGVVGKDILLEQGAEGLYELLDLRIAKCRLMTAGPAESASRPTPRRLRVASKFVNIAKRHYAEQGVHAELIKLYGAMELAPMMQLADQIVDIVDTGNTLRANGMVPIDCVAQISSRLVVNKAAMRAHHALISRLLAALAAARPAET